MKDILIIAHFTQAPGEKGNGRFHYIAEKINKSSAKIEVVTSSFSHRAKKKRTLTTEQLNSISYKFTMLFEPGYKKNVTIKRFYSHYIFSKSLKKYLQKRVKPDVIYCAVPSLDVAKVAANYAKQNHIRFIIDVQDLWPEAFKMIFNVPIVADILFFSMKRKADLIYATADEIIAVSESYLARALNVNRKCKRTFCIFLGTDLADFDRMAEKNQLIEKTKGEFWLGYVGTLGNSYDIKIVIDALKILEDKGHKNIKFIVMGDGPLKSGFENYSKEKGVNTKFTNRLEYSQMIGILKKCDIVVNPIKSGSAASIINKHADYVAAGLPVINTQESPEYRRLVDEYQIGLNCENNNAANLAEQILKLYTDVSLRKYMGENSRKLAEEKFDRKNTYNEILSLLNEDQMRR